MIAGRIDVVVFPALPLVPPVVIMLPVHPDPDVLPLDVYRLVAFR